MNLTENLDLYLSETGSNANNGLAPGTAKATWTGVSGIENLLQTITPNEYSVTVHVSGMINDDLYRRADGLLTCYNLTVAGAEGSNIASTGFRKRVVVSGGASITIKNIRCTKLYASRGGFIDASNTTIMVGGLAANTPDENFVNAIIGSYIQLQNTTIKYQGTAYCLLYGSRGGIVNARNCILEAVENSTFSVALFDFTSGSALYNYEASHTQQNGASATALVTYRLYGGASVDQLLPGLPGSSLLELNTDGMAALRGTTIAQGRVGSIGVLSSGSFGFASIEKTRTGQYTLITSLPISGNTIAQITPIGSSPHYATATLTNPDIIKVYMFAMSGTAADYGFSITVL